MSDAIVDKKVFVSLFNPYYLSIRTIIWFGSKWKKEMEELDELIKSKELKIDESHYYTNGYDAPFKLWNRRNEVWRVKLDE